MDPIEALPLADITDEQATALLEFSYGVEKLTRHSTAMAIVMTVARHTLLHGECRVSHKEFGRRSGVCRRTVDVAIKLLKRYDLVEVVDRSESGAAIYRANLGGGRSTDALV